MGSGIRLGRKENMMSATTVVDFIEEQDTLDLQISDPVMMLNEIARRYESTERILMEYVDNALDDAESLYRENSNAYPYQIHIEVIIDGAQQSVIVRDNCRGMPKEILERIIRNVGESQKRGLTWVNGRFGFGVQAFRAAADVIRFQTRHAQNPHWLLELERNQHFGIKGAQSLAEPFPSDTGTGSMVTINGFEDEWFENISVTSIKQEIESHFERLLARPNLTITVQEVHQEPVRCEPFQYEDVPGKDIQRVLKLRYKGRVYPIEVHLKIADFEVPGRTVRFFARGRRINHVTEIKSFLRKSTYRTSVWGHPHLLGYIEVGEIVRPVITRDDFVRNKSRNLFYEAILGLEEELKNALDRINEAQRDSTLNRLEDVLRTVLESIARQDRRRLRLHSTARRKKPSAQSKETAAVLPESAVRASEGESLGLGYVQGVDDDGHPRPGSSFGNGLSSSPANGGSSEQASPVDQKGETPQPFDLTAPSEAYRPLTPTPGPDDRVEFRYENETNHPSDRPQPKRRRSTFDIQFFDIPADAEGQVKRSYLVDATIYINVAHPDFQERMTYTRQGQPKVTDRLGAYIAATVSIHYKDQFYAKYGYMPERRDLLFDEQVDFMFRLESALREHLPALEKELARQKRLEDSAE
jgi:hypothetical protein